jgi:hypothetical protein
VCEGRNRIATDRFSHMMCFPHSNLPSQKYKIFIIIIENDYTTLDIANKTNKMSKGRVFRPKL